MQPAFRVSTGAFAMTWFLGFALVCTQAVCAQRGRLQSADTLLVNGKVLTADHGFSIGQAVAIREGKIAGVGSTAEMKRLADSKTRVIDLDGRTVIPGHPRRAQFRD
jgi:adenine deaminase